MTIRAEHTRDFGKRRNNSFDKTRCSHTLGGAHRSRGRRIAGMLSGMRYLVLLFMLAGVACATAAPEVAAAEAGMPYNFVVILADDLGAGELACYGHPTQKTPNL